MRIVAVDDMPLPRKALERAIREANPAADVLACASGDEVLALADLTSCDVVFADIDMPSMSGIELALRLKQINPRINVIFVTGYGDYMADAFALHTSGYVMKPVTALKIANELENLRYPPWTHQNASSALLVRCFGNFEVLAHGEPVAFGRAKAKELFAYLVDRRGALCPNGEVETVLWEERPASRSLRSYLRTTVAQMRSALREVGHEDVVVKRRGVIGIRTDALACDYYRYLDGDPLAINAFRGEYMSQYSWAEVTRASLM